LPQKIHSMIRGIGAAVPDKILTNQDLERMVDTSDEWITARTGIQRRHIVSDNVLNSDLSAQAARQALSDAGMSAEEIDVIVLATVTGDMTFPSTACFVQEKIGAVNAAAMDISAACTGFIYGLTLVDGMIAAGHCRNALVIGCEVLSRIVDWSDRSTCVLFGDAAGAAVVTPADGRDGRGILGTYIKSDGRLTHLLNMPGGGTKVPPRVALEEDLFYLRMEGREVFKAAVNAMGEASQRVLEKTGLGSDQIDLFIPHQANIRIIRATAKKLNLPDGKVYVNVHEYGNTSAASVPLALTEARQKGLVKAGDTVLMVAFGGGLTWGSAVVRL